VIPSKQMTRLPTDADPMKLHKPGSRRGRRPPPKSKRKMPVFDAFSQSEEAPAFTTSPGFSLCLTSGTRPVITGLRKAILTGPPPPPPPGGPPPPPPPLGVFFQRGPPQGKKNEPFFSKQPPAGTLGPACSPWRRAPCQGGPLSPCFLDQRLTPGELRPPIALRRFREFQEGPPRPPQNQPFTALPNAPAPPRGGSPPRPRPGPLIRPPPRGAPLKACTASPTPIAGPPSPNPLAPFFPGAPHPPL